MRRHLLPDGLDNLEAVNRIEPPRRSAAGGVWQSAFLTPRTVANGAIPEEPRTKRPVHYV